MKLYLFLKCYLGAIYTLGLHVLTSLLRTLLQRWSDVVIVCVVLKYQNLERNGTENETFQCILIPRH